MTTISLSNRRAATIRADALVVGTRRRGKDEVVVDGVDGVDLSALLTAMTATGEIGDLVRTATTGAVTAPLLVAVGLGDADEPTDLETLRRAAGAALAALGKYEHVAVALPAADAEQVGAVAEGALLGAYVYDTYVKPKRPRVAKVTVLSQVARQASAKRQLDRSRTVVDGVNLARDLVNTPPNELYPETFVSRVKAAAATTPLRITVLDETQLGRKGYGGILSVGKGSGRPPRLMRIAYRPPKARGHLAYVGKGITFDSGGYSIKPGPAMVAMKSDMAGAAAVAAAVLAIAELGLPVSITAYAALAENMVSGDASRPGDVVTMFGGKTVEITNTDAEGRMVLGDAIVTASADKPDAIVDVATLTGHIVAAMGLRVAGSFSNDEGFGNAMTTAARKAGESLWPMPIPDEVREQVRSSRFADLAQVSGERAGGAVYAAGFLREFVGDSIPWVHIDMAGPGYNDGSAYGYTPRGATGMMVRTLVQLASDHASD